MIKIELNDWLFNAGLVGFYKILQDSKANSEALDISEVKITKNCLEFDEKLIENFEDKYFGFFIKNYINFTPYGKIVGNREKLQKWKESLENFDEKNLKEFNDITKFTKDKLARNSYKGAYALIEEKFDVLGVSKGLGTIKLNKGQSISELEDDIQKQIEIMLQLMDWIEKPHIKRLLLSKEFTYTFTSDFFSNVAIWGKTNASKNPYTVFNEFFVEPFFKYNEADKSKFKNSCINCEKKVNSQFETGLTWINAMGADSAKKPAHYWNFNSDISVCPICTLIYSCIPAGFQYLNGKGFFINSNNRVKEIIALNTPKYSLFSEEKFSIENLELRSYFDIANAMGNKSQENFDLELDNIQVVKFDSGNAKRPYTFNVLNKKNAYIIYKSQKLLECILTSRIKLSEKEYMIPYEEVIKRLFANKNLFDLIHKLICLNSLFVANVVMNIQSNIVKIKKEGTYMYKDIVKSREIGFALRRKYEAADVIKKVDTITYKLLNALKVKSSNKFLDIVINSYMSFGSSIPDVFLQTLMNEDKLLHVGYAFVLGLKGEVKDKEKQEDNQTIGGTEV